MSVNLKNSWKENYSFFASFSSSRKSFSTEYFLSEEKLKKIKLRKDFDFESWKNNSILFEDISQKYLEIIDCEEKIVKFSLEISDNLISLEKTEDLLEKNPDFLENLRKQEFLKESKFLRLKRRKKILKEKEKFWEDIENALKIKENIFKNSEFFENTEEIKEESSKSLLEIENFDYLNFDLRKKNSFLSKQENYLEPYISDVLYEKPEKLAIVFEISDIFDPFTFKQAKEDVFFKKIPDLSEEFLKIDEAIDETIKLYFSTETFEGEFKKPER